MVLIDRHMDENFELSYIFHQTNKLLKKLKEYYIFQLLYLLFGSHLISRPTLYPLKLNLGYFFQYQLKYLHQMLNNL